MVPLPVTVVLAGDTVEMSPERVAVITLLLPFATVTEKVFGLPFFAKLKVDGAVNVQGIGVGAGVGVGVGYGVAIGVGTGVASGVGIGIGVAVGRGVGVASGSGVGVGVGYGVALGEATGVAVG
jgi:hypothetical protein